MKIVTAPGVTYVVYAAAGATVTCPDRPDPLLTCAGGKPNYFTAPGAEVEISDDSFSIEACRDIKIEVSGGGGSGGSGGGEWTDIRPLSNTWTGTNTFNGTVRFASGDLHKTINSNTLTSTSVLNMGEADGRYALKGEGGGGDSGLTPEQVEKLTLYASAEGRNIPAAPQIATEIGHTYTVSATASPVVVTDANGETRCTVPAGKQLSFVATTTTTNLSATDCTITENFKGAAHVVLSGGGGSTGGGEPEGDYLTFNADRSVRGGRLNEMTNCKNLCREVRQKSWDIPLPSIINGDYMFYDSYIEVFGVSLNTLQTAYFMFRNGRFTAWNIPLPSLTDGRYMFSFCNFETLNMEYPKLTNGLAMHENNTSLLRSRVVAPKMTMAQDFFKGSSKMVYFEGDWSAVSNGIAAFYNCPMTEGADVEFPSLSSGTNMFYNSRTNKATVLKICNSLPTWTSGSHPIQFGIHVDHKYDPEVNAALKRLDANYEPLNLPIDETTGDYVEITEDKGWTLSVQWNGTATENAYPNPAATYSLRPQVAPVYAKMGEDSDGTPYLDWGHYVTNWEENGYMEFASLEEAREYFNITE